ncbi:MAG: 50S ribosomal protein L20, partial [Candidatus Nomurabacteria bacterium GW2011_GWF2_43_8]
QAEGVISQAKEALLHAGNYAFAHRKDKKSHNRKLWNIKINAGARELGLSYSKLIGALKKKSIMLDRKILADFAEHHPNTFAKILEAVK